MAENLKLARTFMIVLAIVTIGRWTLSLKGVPYEKGTWFFSIVPVTLFSSIYYAAFTRRWRGFGLGRAMALTMTLAVIAQLVILISTAVSYMAGMTTYFNSPQALNVTEAIPMGQALQARAIGLVVNTVLNAIAGLLGWLFGGALPER